MPSGNLNWTSFNCKRGFVRCRVGCGGGIQIPFDKDPGRLDGKGSSLSSLAETLLQDI